MDVEKRQTENREIREFMEQVVNILNAGNSPDHRFVLWRIQRIPEHIGQMLDAFNRGQLKYEDGTIQFPPGETGNPKYLITLLVGRFEVGTKTASEFPPVRVFQNGEILPPVAIPTDQLYLPTDQCVPIEHHRMQIEVPLSDTRIPGGIEDTAIAIDRAFSEAE